MTLIIPPRIPKGSKLFEITVGAEIPDRVFTWIDPATGLPYQFATDPHTFELRINLGNGIHIKNTGISGNNGDPNILITFASDELIGLPPGHYHAQLWGRRTSDGKDLEPIDFRLVALEAIGLSGPPISVEGDSFVPGDLIVGGSIIVSGGPLPGTELAYAERVSTFSTGQEYATAVPIPGLSITFDVPNRPFIVMAIGGLLPAATGHGVAMGIWNVDENRELTHGATGGLSQQIAIDVTPTMRIPNTFHAPIPGQPATYECRLFVTTGSGSGSLIAGNFFGPEYVAFIRAYVT